MLNTVRKLVSWNMTLIWEYSALISRPVSLRLFGFCRLQNLQSWLQSLWNRLTVDKINLYEPVSYLGSPIRKSETARLNEAYRFFRVSSNLTLGRKRTLEKFARFIRYGLLSVSDAEALLLGRLPVDKLRRYQLAKYWISSGFDQECSFYYNPAQLWQKEKVDEANIIPFP